MLNKVQKIEQSVHVQMVVIYGSIVWLQTPISCSGGSWQNPAIHTLQPPV